MTDEIRSMFYNEHFQEVAAEYFPATGPVVHFEHSVTGERKSVYLRDGKLCEFGVVPTVKLQIKLLGGKDPCRREDSAGYDCYAKGNVKIPALGRARFPLGFAAAFDNDFICLLLDKSGMGNKGIMKLAGVIEASYRDEWQAILYNTTPVDVLIPDGSACIQALFFRYGVFDKEIVEELPPSLRGKQGFGSTAIMEAFAKDGRFMLGESAGVLDMENIQKWIDGGYQGEVPAHVLDLRKIT